VEQGERKWDRDDTCRNARGGRKKIEKGQEQGDGGGMGTREMEVWGTAKGPRLPPGTAKQADNNERGEQEVALGGNKRAQPQSFTGKRRAVAESTPGPEANQLLSRGGSTVERRDGDR